MDSKRHTSGLFFQRSWLIQSIQPVGAQSASQYQHHWYLTHHSSLLLASCFTFSMLAAFSHFEMLDIYWPMYLSHFSLPALQYPSPLHGHRWITRPGLALLAEWCCSSENTPLPSYSNGLSAGCPPAHTMADREGDMWEEEWERRKVLGRDRGGLMRRGELSLSLGETGMPTVSLSADRGIRSFRNSTQPQCTNCSSSSSSSSPPSSFTPPPCFMPLSRQVGRSSETGAHRLPLKSLKGNWAFQPTPLICATLPTS